MAVVVLVRRRGDGWCVCVCGGGRKTERAGGRRGGGCAAPVILHHKSLHCFKKQPSQEVLRDVRESAEALLLPENPCGCLFFSSIFIYFYFIFWNFNCSSSSTWLCQS